MAITPIKQNALAKAIYLVFLEVIALISVGIALASNITKKIEHTIIPIPWLIKKIIIPSVAKADKTNDTFRPVSTLL